MVELVYKLDEKSTTSVEKVSRPLKCHAFKLLGGSHILYMTYINGHQHRSHNPCSHMCAQGNNFNCKNTIMSNSTSNACVFQTST